MEQSEQTTPVPEQQTPSEPTTTQPESVVPQDESTPATSAPEPAPTQPPTPEPPPASEPPPTTVTAPQAGDYTLPEGVPQQMAEFAAANNLTQEQLDASIQQYGTIQSASESVRQQQLRQLGEAHVEKWGEEGQYKLSIAKRALAQNDPDSELTKLLNETGYGNHPVVLDFLHRIGGFMKEGGFLKSSQSAGESKKTLAQTMYPDLPSKEK